MLVTGKEEILIALAGRVPCKEISPKLLTLGRAQPILFVCRRLDCLGLSNLLAHIFSADMKCNLRALVCSAEEKVDSFA